MPGHRRILLRCLVLVDFQEIRHLRRFAAKTSCLVVNAHGCALCSKTYDPPATATVCLGGLEIC